MKIRKESENDFDQIYDLVRVAFQTAKVSNGKEQDFVNQLRSGANYIPELALIAEDNGNLVGHIMLTKAHVIDNNNKLEVLLLAPISVLLKYRQKGIGSELINESFVRARKMGYEAVFLVGDPAFYTRFGFKTLASFGLKHTQDIPDQYCMSCELFPGALEGISGTVDCF